MDTRTTTRSNRSSSVDRNAFGWGGGAIAGAAIGGAMVAIAANLGRKLAVRGMSAAKGNWVDSLTAEHEAVLALFDKLLATKDNQTAQRAMLLMKIGHALDKHAYAEEHVVYPSLREANNRMDAERLEKEHGEVKTYLHRLQNMEKSSPEFLRLVGDFRSSVARHAKLEEQEIFPKLRIEISDELDARITREVNKAGFLMA